MPHIPGHEEENTVPELNPLPQPAPETVEQPEIQPLPVMQTNSIVDFLTAQGQPSDFGSRAKIAEQFGIQNYTGTAEQNLGLLSRLQSGEQAPALPQEAQPQEAPAEQQQLQTTEEDVDADTGDFLDSFLQQFGLDQEDDEDEVRIDPFQTFSKQYQDISRALGLPDIRAQLEAFNKQRTDIELELNDKISDVNENPWLTEGVRRDRIESLKNRYRGRLDALTNQMDYLSSLDEQGRQQAQFIASTAVSIAQEQSRAERAEDQDRRGIIMEAIKFAERQQDAERRFGLAERQQAFKESEAGLTDDLREFFAAQQAGFTGDFFDFKRQVASAQRAPSGGGGGFAVPFSGVGGFGQQEQARPTFEEFLAQKEEEAGQSFNQARRDQLRREFETLNASQAPSNVRDAWLSDPNIDPIVKQIIRGDLDVSNLSDKEQRALGSQLEAARAEGVIPIFTNKERSLEINRIKTTARQDTDIKEFSDIRSSYETARSAVQQGGGAGDIVLMRMIAKITDPTTGVREEEFRTFENAQSVLARFGVALTKKMWSGDRLTDFGRRELFRVAQDRYDQELNAYSTAYDFYANQVAGVGGTEEDFLPRVVAPEVDGNSFTSSSGNTYQLPF